MTARLLAAAAIVWAAAIPAAALAAGRPAGDAGAHAFAAAVYVFGSTICHQRPERSFELAGAQLAVCARCTGIYAGAALIAAASLVGSGFSRIRMLRLKAEPTTARMAARTAEPRAKPTGERVVLAVSLVPAVISLIYEWTTGDVPSNGTRAATGLVLGSGVAAVVLTAVGNRVN